MYKIWIAAVFAVLFVPADSQRQVDIRGVYGHPGGFWKQGLRLNQLNVNAVFLHYQSIDDTFMIRARAEKQKVFAEFATLNGGGYVEEHPEAWAVDNTGKKVQKATWFMGVCPTDSAFRNYRLHALEQLLNTYDIDGVWLDYLHWHAQFEDPEPILPETCFNNSCLKEFQKYSGIRIPDGTTAKKADFILKRHENKWRKWRTVVLANWVKECRKIINRVKPGALLGIYHSPWNDVEYDSARIRILGLDYELLKPHTDVFSPMVYHGRMEREPKWVKENIEWFSKKINDQRVKIWPIVQAHNDPAVITHTEFERVLRNGLSGSATGVMMFTSNAVAEDSSKIAVLKKVYGEWRVGESTPLSHRWWAIK